MKTRSFIAINLPDEIKKEIGFFIEKLSAQGGDIKWVRPEGIHLTLHFLGSLDEHQIEEVKKIIADSVGNSFSTEIQLKGLNAFPNLEKPKVLFISGQENGTTLQQIQIEIGQQLEKIGIVVDHRPWQIHFTLARLNAPSHLLITNLNELRMKTFKVNSIDLMKSELTPRGALYSLIEKFNLK